MGKLVDASIFTPVLNAFRDYLGSNIMLKQDILFPPDQRGGQGGEARSAKLPTDWVAKKDPISGGEMGAREKYGNVDSRGEKKAKSGDPYFHKHLPGEGTAYEESQGAVPGYKDGSAHSDIGDAEHYAIEKDEEEEKDWESDEKQDEEMMEGHKAEAHEDDEEDEDMEEMYKDGGTYSMMKQIRALLRKDMELTKRAISRKTEPRTISKQVNIEDLVQKGVKAELQRIGIKFEEKASKTETAPVPIGGVEFPSTPFGNIEDPTEFRKAVKVMAGPTKMKDDSFKGLFKKLNDLRNVQSANFGIRMYTEAGSEE